MAFDIKKRCLNVLRSEIVFLKVFNLSNNHGEEPAYGFTPDADYPLIYAEKGIRNYQATRILDLSPIIAMNGGVVSNAVCDSLTVTLKEDKKFESYLKENKINCDFSPMEGLTIVRFKGIAAHEKLGKTYHIVNCDDSYTRTYSDFTEYFGHTKKGYFVAYRDSIAAAIENAATDVGLKVPEDIEVLSLVGTKYANIVRPSLTSMQIDMSEVGKRAMYMY